MSEFENQIQPGNDACAKLNIVLFRPEIPHNTGAVGRLALSTGTRLHLIRPLGFLIDDKAIKRTGLDYWPQVDLKVWDSLEELKEAAGAGARFWYFTTKRERMHWDVEFREGDYLVFGPESRGLPKSLLEQNEDSCVTLSMPGKGARSLNLATSVAIGLYEGLRQLR